AKYAELDLGGFHGHELVELFGRSRFPSVGERPYALSLAPHAFFWFALEPSRQRIELAARPVRELPELRWEGPWEALVTGRGRPQLARVLVEDLPTQRWFGAKTRTWRGWPRGDA